jgi:hypothetical protein
LATPVLGGGVSSTVVGFDSFADSVLSERNFALLARGTSSSSSSELLENKYTLLKN